MQDQEQRMARYQRLRFVGKEVHEKMINHLSRDDIHTGAQALGILKRGVLVLDNPQEMAVVMDYCIHNVRRRGLNAVDRLLAEAPYPPGGDHAIFAEALAKAWFSCFLVDSVEPGVGVRVRDVVRREELLLIHDLGFSQTGEPGVLFASRLTAPDDILMTTGFALPIGVRPPGADPAVTEQSLAELSAILTRPRTPDEISAAVAGMIRLCLNIGAMDHIAFQDLDESSRPGPRPTFSGPRPTFSGPRRTPVSGPPSRIGRNSPCPCGSGRKFKVCCGARR